MVCCAAGLGRSSADWRTAGAHPRCDRSGRPPGRVGPLRHISRVRLSRVRHPGGMDDPAGWSETGVAVRVVPHAAAPAPDRVRFVDGPGVGRLDCRVDARWRFRRMARLDWHPFLRINQGGTFRLAGQARCVWWSTLVGAAGRCWRGRGTAFASSDCRLDGTLAAWWSDGHAEPWLVLTDRDPDGCDAPWDTLRSWCDQRGAMGMPSRGWC
jgi:hypothetical protein